MAFTSLCGSCESLLSWDITDSYSLIFVASLRSFPVNMILTLACAIADPIESRVHGFGSALNNCVGDDTNCTFVVELEWGWALLVTHFCECGAHRSCIFGVDLAGSGFRGFLD